MKRIIHDSVIIKSFNNNIVLIQKDNKEKLLFAKGIGFGKRPGDIIPSGTLVEKVFVIEDEQNLKNFNNLINANNENFIILCEEIIYKISEEFGEDLNENIHISLTNHLAFALQRLKDGQEIENPFLVEIETLYNSEFKLAQEIAKKIKNETNIIIPDGEAAFIALHIHSARNNGKLSNTIKYSFLASKIVEYVEDEIGISVNRKSLDYARFLTHIRFAVERIMNNKCNKNDLKETIKRIYKKSYKIAIGVGKIIEDELDIEVDEDEIAYLAMHIERLRIAVL
ncbi:glucose PTS transporter transcription antiterminator GlcT [Clostridium fallax]|uniref:Transcriptional antiterminator, BglG family n=1 Tax=Clostridium fallax TaxID=1533 RepID=A0A1M4ZI72_9CLOT|nr:PRD domain-containing protein [Clostridium fallax]SHF17675.1 transcriptional antiterminator, BglG family [Clostridium fallax]SQB22225.1 transcription antiterminator LicT [Clostridium fallax]